MFSRMRTEDEICYFTPLLFYISSLTATETRGRIDSILGVYIAACGAKRICDQSIIKQPNWTIIDPEYCSPCARCYCDEFCHSVHDCCLDIEMNLTHVGDAKRKWTHSMCTKSAPLQFNWLGKKTTLSYDKTYPLITKCPNDYQDGDRVHKCEHANYIDSESAIPVSSNVTGLSYKNMDCFICHNDSQPLIWDLKIENCQKQYKYVNVLSLVEIITNAFDSLCTLTFQPNLDLDLRKCPAARDSSRCDDVASNPDMQWGCHNSNNYNFCPHCSDNINTRIVSTCNDTGHWQSFDEVLYRGCEEGPVIATRYFQFKNLHCYLCNKEDNLGDQCKDVTSSVYGRNSLGALFDMKALFGSLLVGRKDSKKCDQRQFFDPYQRICRQKYCPLGYYFQDERCISIIKDGQHDLRYKVFFVLRAVDNLSREFICANILENVQSAVNQFLYKEIRHIETTSKFSFVSFTSFNATVFDRKNTTDKFSSQTIGLSIKNSNEPLDGDIFVSFDLVTHPIRNISGVEQALLKSRYNIYNITQGGSTFSFQAHIDDRSYVLSKKDFGENDSCIINTNANSELPDAYTIVGNLLVCEQVELQIDEYKMQSDHTIFVYVILHTLSISKYRILTEKARVCIEDYVDSLIHKKSETPSYIQLYLSQASLICSNISLVFVLLTLFTYCVFPKYRTLPGKLNMCLALAMFLSLLLYVLSYYISSRYPYCVVLGTLLHYSLLCYFFSMNSCCLQMYRIFCGRRVSRENLEQKCKLVTKHVIYILCTPACIVCPTITLHILSLESPKYGKQNQVCFIVDPLSRALSFVLPVTLLVVLNAVFFLCTLGKVYSTPRMPSDRGFHDHVRSFAKLFTLTGLTWLLQFVDASLEYAEVSYSLLSLCVTVLNSSQGIFIFLAFVCNSRVYNSYLHLLQQCRSSTPNNVADQTEIRRMDEAVVNNGAYYINTSL